jgi:hypothetical protein
MEENVPVKTPKNITSANGRITSPAKMMSDRRVARVVPWVRTLRGRVSFTERLRMSRSHLLVFAGSPHPVEDDDGVVESSRPEAPPPPR